MKSLLCVGLVVATGVFAASAMASDGLLRTEGMTGVAHAAPVPNTAKEEGLHTVTWWCVDLNDLWHVDVPVIVGRGALTPPVPSPLPPCPSTSSFPIIVGAGSGWTSGGALIWFTNTTNPPLVAEALAAMGYNFVSNSPMQDLRQKIIEVRYVVRTFPSNAFVTEFSFDPRQNFRLVRTRQFFGERPLDPIVNADLGIHISAEGVGRLPLIHFPGVGGGLPPGSYRAEVFWVLSELHNDGLGLDDGVDALMSLDDGQSCSAARGIGEHKLADIRQCHVWALSSAVRW